MPCDDVTEILVLELDSADRLTAYQLLKRSCGRAVGEKSLIEEEVVGLPASQLLALPAEEFGSRFPLLRETEMFLRLKHFFALQSGLRVLMGIDPGSALDPVRVARIGATENGVTLEAELVVEVIVEQIKACGNCRGCASKLTAAVC